MTRRGAWCGALTVLLPYPAAADGMAAQAPEVLPGPAAPGALSPEQQQVLQQMADIRDIAPPVEYGWDPRWLWAGLALLVAALALLAWRYWRRRRGGRSAVPAVPPVAPDQRALQELAALGAAPGLTDKGVYFRLSEILRRYLDQRFGVDTLEMTTEELVPVLTRLPLGDAAGTSLVGLLRDADPVKYADRVLGPERRRADLERAAAFVRATAPAGDG